MSTLPMNPPRSTGITGGRELNSSPPFSRTVGIETGFLYRPMTGIGNYTFNILQSMFALNPTLRVIGFREVNWREVNAATLDAIATQHGKARHPDISDSRESPISRIRRKATAAVASLADVQSARTVYRRLKQLRFATTVSSQPLDIFHAFNFRPPADPGIPVLHVIHDLSTFRYPGHHPAERVNWVNRMAGSIAAAPLVQTISEFTKREIVEVLGYPAEKIFVAPPAAAPVFVPAGEAATQRDLDMLHLCYGDFFLAVGTMEPRKNIRTVIAAYGMLPAKERKRYPLIVVGGKGWGDLELPKQTSALLAEGSLRFVRGISDPQLRSLYEGARLLLMPSLYEGFGMPAVEAMACGTQVAHSANTAMDEISGHDGLRIPAQDIERWHDALKQSLDSTSHSDQTLRSGRIAQAARFSWTTSASAVLDAYRIVSGENPAPN